MILRNNQFIFTTLLMNALCASSHASESRFQILEKKYNEPAVTLSNETLEGTYIGRCFSEESDDPKGSLLLTRRVESRAAGPQFPSPTTSGWQMAIGAYHTFGIFEAESERNDRVSKEDVDSFWGAANDSEFRLNIVNNIASATSVVVIDSITVNRPNPRAPLRVDAKLNADGYIYSKSTLILKKNNPTLAYLKLTKDINLVNRYCYYWKKVLSP